MSVFNYRGGPCYRCVFPAPLAVEAGRRCSDNGVLGTVPGEKRLVEKNYWNVPAIPSVIAKTTILRRRTE